MSSDIKKVLCLALSGFILSAGAPAYSAAKKNKGKTRSWGVQNLGGWEISHPPGFITVREGNENKDGAVRVQWRKEWKDALAVREYKRVEIGFLERIAIHAHSTTAILKPGKCLTSREKPSPVIEGRNYDEVTYRWSCSAWGAGETRGRRHYYVVDLGQEDRIFVEYMWSYTTQPAYTRLLDKYDGKDGPNFQNYLEMLTTLQPRDENAGGETLGMEKTGRVTE